MVTARPTLYQFLSGSAIHHPGKCDPVFTALGAVSFSEGGADMYGNIKYLLNNQTLFLKLSFIVVYFQIYRSQNQGHALYSLMPTYLSVLL